jgi:glycosyltransferase involved in cell wall biosynthesis
MQPIVMISSWPMRQCGIGTFAEEACEFIHKAHPDRRLVAITHTDGASDYPIIDMSRSDWWRPVAEVVNEIEPYAIHIQHEYGLYEYIDERGIGDRNEGFIDLLVALKPWPKIVEPHTVHGRMSYEEANFVYRMAQESEVLLVKADYQLWRMQWTFSQYGWPMPGNIMVVPHGARPDMQWGPEQIPSLREELGLNEYPKLGEHLVGLVGWIQSNKRWDIMTSIWEECAREIEDQTGEDWDLLAAGTWRDPNHRQDYEMYVESVDLLEKKGLAHYYEFVPRGPVYYKVMAVCDFIVLPSVDETQSGTLARIIAMNKPYITTAPLEALTSQTLESDGGLLFTNREMLKRQVLRLGTDPELRMKLGDNLKKYLEEVVSWEIVARQYAEAYQLARQAAETGAKPVIPAGL